LEFFWGHKRLPFLLRSLEINDRFVDKKRRRRISSASRSENDESLSALYFHQTPLFIQEGNYTIVSSEWKRGIHKKFKCLKYGLKITLIIVVVRF
jgi:hypothetical protein